MEKIDLIMYVMFGIWYGLIAAQAAFIIIKHLNHDRTDNRPENLQALCQKCHLELDKNQHRVTRWENKHKNIPALPGMEGK